MTVVFYWLGINSHHLLLGCHLIEKVLHHLANLSVKRTVLINFTVQSLTAFTMKGEMKLISFVFNPSGHVISKGQLKNDTWSHITVLLTGIFT